MRIQPAPDLVYTRNHLEREIRKYGWEIGEHSYGEPTVRHYRSGRKLRIGRYCAIARGVTILLGGNHHTEWVTTYPFNRVDERARHLGPHLWSKGDVVIGNDVWLGQDCTILSGVSIGDGACVGTAALVTRDVPPYAIVGGNPARLLRQRFDPVTIEALRDIAWWDWSEDEIAAVYPLLMAPGIDAFIRHARAKPR